MKRSYRYIVVGAGALGSSAAYRLAKAGESDVLVIEQFELGHGKGSSEDHSRIIRHAYHSEIYTALTHAMYDAWAEVEEESGVPLIVTTGTLELAKRGTPGEAELGNYRSAFAPGVSFEDLDAAEIRRRWPQWRIDDDVVGLFQKDGGLIDVRKAVAVNIALARARGVTFLPGTAVTALDSAESQVTVHTTGGDFTAEAVVLCVASWAARLLPSLGIDWPITLSQEQVSYFATPNVRDFTPDRFPVWIWHGDPLFYGFPIYGEVAVKIARDVTGRWTTVDERSYEPLAEETRFLECFLNEHLPGAAGPELCSKTCVYDMPGDRDFILDKIPGHPRVVIGMGAAHAAKFASLIGTILADLVIRGDTAYPINAFRADRPALTDPSFKPVFRMYG